MYSPATASHPPRRGGFTVIEFLVCMSVLGLLLALAVPAFGRWLREAEMTRAVNALVTDVHRARQTAHMQARTVKLCASSRGVTCDDRLDWSNGWLVAQTAVEVDAVRTLSRVARNRAEGIRIIANRRFFEFRPFTLRDTNGSLWFCDLRGRARPRRVVISPSGRPRLTFATDSKASINCEA